MALQRLRLHGFLDRLLIKTISSIYVYAPTGSGKTHYGNDQATDGIPSINTKVPLDLLRFWAHEDGFTASRNTEFADEDHEIAWFLSYMTRSSDIELIFSAKQGMLMMYAMRYGFTVVGVWVDESTLKRNVISRPDLRMSDIQFERTSAKINLVDSGNLVSAWFNDFDSITKHITTRHFAYMEYPPFRGNSLPSGLDEHHGFGTFVREHMMMDAHNRGKVYVGFGDEAESIATAARLGIKSRHINTRRLPIREYASLDPNFSDEISLDENFSVDRGQLKLKVVDSPMVVGVHETVLVIGGSPGTHFQDWNQGIRKYILVDPVKPSVEGMTWIDMTYDAFTSLDDLVPTGTYVVLWDVRTNRNSEMSADDWEQAVLDNWNLMMLCENAARISERCLGMSLKIRPSRLSSTFSLPNDVLIVPQPYIWGKSTECRGYVWYDATTDAFSDVSYSVVQHGRKMRHWNFLRQRDPSLDRVQSGGILTLRVETEDMKFFNLASHEAGYAIFSVSNRSNDRGLASEMLSRGDVTIVVPHSGFSRPWTDGHLGITFDRFGLTSSRKGESYSDWTYTPTEFLSHNVYNLNDFAVAVDYEQTPPFLRRDQHPRTGFDGTHPFMRLWFVARSEPLFSGSHQTWLNSQTHLVRLISPALREIYGHDKGSLHIVRRAVLTVMGGVPVNDNRVNGYFLRDEKRFYVAVSGHLINLILISAYATVDWKRYFDSIEGNIATYSRSPGAVRSMSLLAKAHLLAEGQWRHPLSLWHGYDDYVLSIPVALVMGAAMGFRCDPRCLLYISGRLRSLKSRFPKFGDMGFQSHSFAQSQKAGRG
jgi:hypothetical protein